MTNQHFNQLTPAQAERLAILAEECAEVVQVIGKILRHGYDSTHPNGGLTNRELLATELGDVKFALLQLVENSDIDYDITARRSVDKKDKIKPYLHHQHKYGVDYD